MYSIFVYRIQSSMKTQVNKMYDIYQKIYTATSYLETKYIEDYFYYMGICKRIMIQIRIASGNICNGKNLMPTNVITIIVCLFEISCNIPCYFKPLTITLEIVFPYILN